MGLNRNGIGRYESIVLFVGFIGLVALILHYNRPPFYDEDDYLRNVDLLQQYGFSKAYLLKHIGSAGPLYPALHYILAPLTKLETPYIRLLNTFLLLGTIYFIRLILKNLQFAQSYAWLVFAIPMTYVISGLALTEIPAVFFFSVALYLITHSITSDSSYFKSVLLLAAAGLFISFAILGRQPFLLILGALPILFFKKDQFFKTGILLLITLIFSLALPCYVFIVWGGLVAPDDGALYIRIAEEGISIQPIFFFLCTAYYAIVFFIATPSFYIRLTTSEILVSIVLTILFIGLNFKYHLFVFLPMAQLMRNTFSPIVVTWAEIIFGVLVLLVSLYFIVTLIRQLIRHNYQKELLFFAAAIMLIALACIKITWGFSSRYPAQALPFLVPMFAYFYKGNKYSNYRLGAGVLLGLTSLASYFILIGS